MRGDGDHNPGYRVVIVTLDSHAAGPCARAESSRRFPGAELSVHAAAEWAENARRAGEARKPPCAMAISSSPTCSFIEEHITAILPLLQARRDHCDAMIGVIARADREADPDGQLDMIRSPKPGP
jgi:magnesium chelatase subunit H